MKAEYVDHMGSDLTVVNSARVSFNKHKEVFDEKDERLIRYLAKHGHFTPFTHPQITLRETVPIFVARQRWKHEVGFRYNPELTDSESIDGWIEGMTINEISRRYVDEDPEFYFPDEWRSRPDGSVKQGSGEILPPPIKRKADFHYSHVIDACEDGYKALLANNVAPEQARMILPQSMYTSYYVTGSLAAWARAYKLRIDSDAQKEIQILAEQWDSVIRPLYPVSWECLTND